MCHCNISNLYSISTIEVQLQYKQCISRLTSSHVSHHHISRDASLHPEHSIVHEIRARIAADGSRERAEERDIMASSSDGANRHERIRRRASSNPTRTTKRTVTRKYCCTWSSSDGIARNPRTNAILSWKLPRGDASCALLLYLPPLLQLMTQAQVLEARDVASLQT